MVENLVIVESPHKAGQIQGYLGKEHFKVVSSKGHIRDLKEKGLGVDTTNGFTPEYVVPAEKKATVSELEKLSRQASRIYLAADPDREGEAIAWHIMQTLALDPAKTCRITYNEITKKAVTDAIGHPREIDMNLVNAQQARRVLDRLVGFELSPILWRKVKRGLSAGRVQSVTLRLVVDREREIAAFVPELYYNVEAAFKIAGNTLKGELDRKFSTPEEAEKFLRDCSDAIYTTGATEKKESVRMPAAPFTTSTLQQEAVRKLHMSISNTMKTAQSLYEKGLITYMRTDSTNLSSLAVNTAKKLITESYGEAYSKPRQFKTRSKNAQEAHEAIRPTFIENTRIEGTPYEQKLYDLIWKRTVASQMAEARLLNSSTRIDIDRRAEKYLIKSSTILFDGFLKLYSKGVDDAEDEENGPMVPEIKSGLAASCLKVSATAKHTQPPYRYTEDTLVKKMEEVGIGRPSTYVPTITTLASGRGYIVTADREGRKFDVTDFTLKDGAVVSSVRTETVGAEKKKFVPQDVGLIVTDYLKENFPGILDYDFTAKVEGDLDKIASGESVWTDVIGDFYAPFHSRVDETLSDGKYSHVERTLGTDPSDGLTVIAKFGQYGPFVQKGEGDSRKYASLAKGQTIESLTLEDALKLFALPRTVGLHEGCEIIARKGRFGAYLSWNGKNVSIPRGKDPLTVSLDECVRLIGEAGNKPAAGAPLKEFDGISVINGRYGPYIKCDGKNYKIPAGTDAASLTEEDCRKIVRDTAPSEGKGRRRFRKSSSK